jgi:hypothetical protein
MMNAMTTPPETREKRRHRRATPISDKKDSVRKRIAFRRDVIREIEKRLPPGLKTTAVIVDGCKTKDTVLKITLEQLGRELGQKPPYSTRYRKAKASKGLTGSFGDRSWPRKAII